jgi:hypothetical protein
VALSLAEPFGGELRPLDTTQLKRLVPGNDPFIAQFAFWQMYPNDPAGFFRE